MQYSEMLAAIHQMEEQPNVLKEMVLLSMHEEESVVNESEETPVINEEPVEEPVMEERKELPAPPKEIYIKVKRDRTPDEETIIGSAILTKFKMSYSTPCRSMTLQWKYQDNSDKINKKTGKPYTEVYRDRYQTIVITAEDINGNPIGTKTVSWNSLVEWHAFLRSRNIFKPEYTNNPHTNGVPHKVHLCID